MNFQGKTQRGGKYIHRERADSLPPLFKPQSAPQQLGVPTARRLHRARTCSGRREEQNPGTDIGTAAPTSATAAVFASGPLPPTALWKGDRIREGAMGQKKGQSRERSGSAAEPEEPAPPWSKGAKKKRKVSLLRWKPPRAGVASARARGVRRVARSRAHTAPALPPPGDARDRSVWPRPRRCTGRPR